MAIGGVIMLIIGYNYHFMMNRYPDAGGTYSYAKKVLGYDHGFLSSWFLILVYIAITWANATALPIIFRNFLGDTFQFDFHYTIAGFDIWLGESLLSLGALWLFGAICMHGGKLAAWVQTIAAIILFGGVLIGIGAVVAAALAYTFLTILAVSTLPQGCANWAEYIGNLDSYEGVEGLPTFHAVHFFMGDTGLVILAVTVCAGVITGLVGNYIAASRLIFALTRDDLLPA